METAWRPELGVQMAANQKRPYKQQDPNMVFMVNSIRYRVYGISYIVHFYIL